MANFNLATQKAARAGSGGGLKAQLIRPGGGARVSAGQIPAGAGQIQFTPANIPKAVEDITAKATLNFMGATAEAAFKYQERESTYFSKQLISAYQQKIIDRDSGYTDASGKYVSGYSSTKGEASQSGYEDFDKGIEEDFYAILESAEPRVQQKAIFQMTTMKGDARSKASKHRLAEFEKITEQRRYADLKDIADRIEFTPERVFSKDSAGMTLRDYGRQNFETDAEFDKWWADTMKSTTDNKYWNTYSAIVEQTGDPNQAAIKAYQEARDYAVKVAQPTLQRDNAGENAVLSSIESFRRKALSAEADMVKIAGANNSAEADKLEQFQLNNLRQLRADIRQGKATTPSESDFVEMTSALGQGDYTSFYNALYKPQTEVGNTAYTMRALSSANEGALTEDALVELSTDPNISQSAFNLIETRNKAAQDKRLGEENKVMNNFVDTMFISIGTAGTVKKLLQGNKAGQIEANRRAAATSQGYSCLKSGKGLEQCSALVDLNFNQVDDSRTSLPPIKFDDIEYRPETMSELAEVNTQLTRVFTSLNSQIDSYNEQVLPLPPPLKDEIGEYEAKVKYWKRWKAWQEKRSQFNQKWSDGSN